MSRNTTGNSVKFYSEVMNDTLLRSVFTYANMHGLTTAKLTGMLSVLYNNSIYTLSDLISFNEDSLCDVLPGFGSDDFHKFKDFSKIMSMVSDGELEGVETLSIKMAVYIFNGLVPEDEEVSPRICCNITARGGIGTLGELVSKSYQEVKSIRGAGNSTMQFFDRMLKFYKLNWSTELRSKESKKQSLACRTYTRKIDSDTHKITITVKDIPTKTETTSYYTLANRTGLTYGKYSNMFSALSALEELCKAKTPGFDYDRVLMFETNTTCKEIILE